MRVRKEKGDITIERKVSGRRHSLGGDEVGWGRTGKDLGMWEVRRRCESGGDTGGWGDH